ncbi:MAG: hypothetical protein ACYCYI_05695, partial [Saccharofermentanales bacterium]
PDDFAFSFSFGINKTHINIIDTYNNIIQKDLIKNGTASTNYDIPNTKLQEVYLKIISLEIDKITQNMTSKNLTKNDIMYEVSPCTYYTIIFTISGKQYTVNGDDTAQYYIDENEQASNFWKFVKYMTNYVHETDEYKSLPSAVGFYR